MELLRSPRVRLGGYVHLARFVDKVRALQRGELPPDYQPNFCRGLDGRLLGFLQIPAQALIAEIGSGADDDAIAEWVRARVEHSPEKIETFNTTLLNRVPETDEELARFRASLEELGLGGRDDIKTYVDRIDADEGREVSNGDH